MDELFVSKSEILPYVRAFLLARVREKTYYSYFENKLVARRFVRTSYGIMLYEYILEKDTDKFKELVEGLGFSKETRFLYEDKGLGELDMVVDRLRYRNNWVYNMDTSYFDLIRNYNLGRIILHSGDFTFM